MARLDPFSNMIAGGSTIVMAYESPPALYPAATTPTIGLQRYDRTNNVWVSVPALGKVSPNEQVRGIADGLAPGKTVVFIVEGYASDPNVPHATLVRQSALAGLGGGVNAAFATPQIPGQYLMYLEVDHINSGAYTIFEVSDQASPPPTGEKPGEGVGGIFKDVKTLVIAGAVIAGLVILGPSIASVIKR